MIVNKPTAADFERQSIQYLNQAIDVLYQEDHDFDEIEASLGVSRVEYWRYNQGVLSNSLALLFLSIENQLKSQICSISPYLLLTDDPKRWGGQNGAKEFSELFIRPFDDLIVLYVELGLGVLSAHARGQLEELRKKRNLITHGVMREALTPEMVLELLQQAIMLVWGPRKWWDKLREYKKQSPMAGISDGADAVAWNTLTIDYLIKILGKKKVGDMLGVNLKIRLYFCPACTKGLREFDDDRGSQYATLSPNTPKSMALYCVICDQTFPLTREKCELDCPGNVMWADDVCLTCFGSRKAWSNEKH